MFISRHNASTVYDPSAMLAAESPLRPVLPAWRRPAARGAYNSAPSLAFSAEQSMRVTRREFGRFASTGVRAVGGWIAAPLGQSAAQPPARQNRSLINGVQFGLQPFCYHDLAMTRENRPTLVKRLVENGMGMVELHATWCEPRFDGPGLADETAREKLREWRLHPPAGYYAAIRKEFDAAG